MALRSTSDRYGRVAIAIHWVSAILIVGLLASGFRAASTLDPAAKAGLLRVHAVVGIAVLALTLFRLAWWMFADRKPNPLAASRPVELAAKSVHALFYVVILCMAASGIGMLLLSGAGAVIFGAQGGALPDFFQYPPRIPHGVGARVLVVALALHVGGALYHQFIARDRIFARMGIGR